MIGIIWELFMLFSRYVGEHQSDTDSNGGREQQDQRSQCAERAEDGFPAALWLAHGVLTAAGMVMIPVLVTSLSGCKVPLLANSSSLFALINATSMIVRQI